MSRQLIKFLSVEARRAGKLRKKLARVEMWLRDRRISQTITRRIRAYYAEVWLPYNGGCSLFPQATLLTCCSCLGPWSKLTCICHALIPVAWQIQDAGKVVQRVGHANRAGKQGTS